MRSWELGSIPALKLYLKPYRGVYKIRTNTPGLLFTHYGYQFKSFTQLLVYVAINYIDSSTDGVYNLYGFIAYLYCAPSKTKAIVC